MKIVKHSNDTFSVTDLSLEDLRDVLKSFNVSKHEGNVSYITEEIIFNYLNKKTFSEIFENSSK